MTLAPFIPVANVPEGETVLYNHRQWCVGGVTGDNRELFGITHPAVIKVMLTTLVERLPKVKNPKVEKKLYSIAIQDGQGDTNIYFSNGQPEVSAENVDLGDDRLAVFKWISFTPNNGYEPGKLMHVPFERLISIQEIN